MQLPEGMNPSGNDVQNQVLGIVSAESTSLLLIHRQQVLDRLILIEEDMSSNLLTTRLETAKTRSFCKDKLPCCFAGKEHPFKISSPFSTKSGQIALLKEPTVNTKGDTVIRLSLWRMFKWLLLVSRPACLRCESTPDRTKQECSFVSRGVDGNCSRFPKAHC